MKSMMTTSEDEKNNCISYGWTYEGIAFNVVTSSDKPIYRLYNPNNGFHIWTASYEEVKHIVECGWRSEGVGFYAD